MRSPQATARKLSHYDACGSLSRAVRRRPTATDYYRTRAAVGEQQTEPRKPSASFHIFLLRKRKMNGISTDNHPFEMPIPAYARWHDAAYCSPQDCTGRNLPPAYARCRSRKPPPAAREPDISVAAKKSSPRQKNARGRFVFRNRGIACAPFSERADYCIPNLAFTSPLMSVVAASSI